MINTLRIFLLPLVTSLLTEPAPAEQVSIFAASSLKTVLDQVIEQQKLDAVAVYGGSAAIARQVAQGADADIMILAHPVWMDWIMEQDVLEQKSRCNLLGNGLVIAGAVEAEDLALKSAKDLIDALEGGHLSVGQLQSVPAGQYAAEYLQNMGWFADLEPYLAQTSNVRQALAYVARGETALGIVYSSDVFAEPRVRAVFTPDAQMYSAIRYPMVISKTASAVAKDFTNVLSESVHIFRENGFLSVPIDEDERCS